MIVIQLSFPLLISNLTCPIHSNLLPLTDESHTPVHSFISSVIGNFSEKGLLITDLGVPVSKSVETLFCAQWIENLLSVIYVIL